MSPVCENCLKPSKDKPEFKATARKGKAKNPAEGFICSRCTQKLLRMTHNASNLNENQRKA